MSNLTSLFDTSDFPERWYCGEWSAAHGWTHITADLATFGAYMTIPLLLAYFIRRRTDVPFPRVFWLFVVFIFACGTTHLMEAVIFWWPAYRFAALFKVLTALASWGAVMALIPTLPKALALPGLAKVNAELQAEMAQRRQSERRLEELTASLEQKVAERTQEAEERAVLLRQVASQLTDAEERERRRIGYILHENLQQLLAASKMYVQHGPRAGGDGAAAQDAANATALLDEAINICRSLATDLTPRVVYDGDLEMAMRWLGRRMGALYGLEVTIRVDADAAHAAPHVRVFCFNVARELLFNIVKHAGVKKARLEVQRSDGQVQLLVADEGAGFHVPARLARGGDSRETGLGLFGMEERVKAIGGTLRIVSSPGHGTIVALTIPDREPTAAPAPDDNRLHKAIAAQPGEAVRVVLADDHTVMRQALATALEREGVTVVGEAADGHRAVQLTRELKPDVVLMDVNMPGMDGIEATRLIKLEMPQTVVVGLSMHDSPEMKVAMLAAGAQSYLDKAAQVCQIVDLLRESRRGRACAPLQGSS